MPRHTSLVRPQGTARGFTLLEMLVVLAIVGLITGLLYPQVETAGFAVRQRLAREQILTGAQGARALALRSGNPATLSIGDRAGTLLITGTGVPARQVALDPQGRIRLAMRPQSIVFYPDGSTTGGQLMLGSGLNAQVFAIDRAGGQVQTMPPDQGGA